MQYSDLFTLVHGRLYPLGPLSGPLLGAVQLLRQLPAALRQLLAQLRLGRGAQTVAGAQHALQGGAQRAGVPQQTLAGRIRYQRCESRMKSIAERFLLCLYLHKYVENLMSMVA